MKDNYEEKYGHIPDDQEDILKYIMENFKIDLDKLQENENHINTLRWENVSILLPVVPKPTPRPRYNPRSKNFYVKGASANKKLIEQFIDDNNIIYTRTKLIVTTYHPIPVSAMKPHEIYLAEKGLLCPTSDPDWDNLGKTYSDMIQGILILNDNIIQKGEVEKFYSLKPRVSIDIYYQNTFDSSFNQKRTVKSKKFKSLNLPEEIIETFPF